ncbi:MAG TPA: glycosyltransferase [Kofleriaceae bacterium]|nr:glycosyltransferase [Kofleriaceae bacterium]
MSHRAPPARRRRLLFVSSNGGGMGHLTRLMAIARRLPADCEPLFLTQSSGIEAVRKLGFWVDYIPPQRASGLGAVEWQAYLRARIGSILRLLGPEAIVFDGTFPYKGLIRAMEEFPQVQRIWSRRAMWKPITAQRAELSLAHVEAFDRIIEPGELAAEADRGFTTTQRDRVSPVEPVLFLDHDEILSREEARAELGIAPEVVAALLNLGAGNINQIDPVLAAVADMLGRDPSVHLMAIQSLISRQGLAVDGGRISRLETYPLSRVIRAFDFCIAAPGYNSFHELLASAVPTVFIPNEQTDIDDQVARAEWAARAGVGLMSRADDLEALDRALTAMLDPAVRDRIGQRCRELPGCDGARQAAAMIAASGWIAPARPAVPVLVPEGSAMAELRRRLWHFWRRVRLIAARLRGARDPEGAVSPKRPGRGRPRGAPRRALVVASGALADPSRIQALGDWIAANHAGAVVLVPADALPPLSRRGLTVELLVDGDARDRPDQVDFAAYARWKSDAVRDAYGCEAVVVWGE